MESAKAASLDRLPIGFYKTFSSKLSPFLGLLFYLKGKNTSHHDPGNHEDRGSLECGSYRPISLLCCDYKILAKILSLYLRYS